MISIDDFTKVDLIVGTVISAKPFPEAKKPAIKLEIDFGELGVKQSSPQITKRYQPEDLVSRQVTEVVNFPPMRIAGCKSEVLVLRGVPETGDVVLLSPEEQLTTGTTISGIS